MNKRIRKKRIKAIRLAEQLCELDPKWKKESWGVKCGNHYKTFLRITAFGVTTSYQYP